MASPSSADGTTPPRYALVPVKDSVTLDPHLQESLHAAAADPNWRPSPSIGHVENGRLYIDVLARLERGQQVPGEIRKVCTIGDIVTGLVAVDEIEAARKQVVSLKSATDLYLNLHYSVPATGCDSAALQKARPDFPGLDGSGVLVGIVDVGCDFRHRNFRTASGDTRILFLWDQSDSDDTGKRPAHYGYGREFTADKINEALRTPDPYKTLGYTPEAGAHGTHVMDIAAGNGREPNLLGGEPAAGPVSNAAPGVAPNAMLAFVHLRTDEESFLGNSRHLLEAVDYIFRKADELNLPAVVNLSLSTTGGPHDGTTLVERGFENLLQAKPGRAIVISAGNAYRKDSHVEGVVRADEPFVLSWQTDPRSDRNEMEIWYAGTDEFTVKLLSPEAGAVPMGPVKLGDTADLYSAGTRVGRISHREDDPNNHDNQIDIRLPTPEPDRRLGFAVPKPETWKVELSTDRPEVRFHAWIEQSDRGLARFEGQTTASCTLGSISCGKSPLCVGAFDTTEKAILTPPWSDTAEGPTRKGEPKPDLSAPGSAIVAARAQGGTTAMAGTSMAAAHVTGLVALLYQIAERGGPAGRLSIDDLRNYLLSSPVAKDSQFSFRLGTGRMMGSSAVEALRPSLPPPPAPSKQRLSASSRRPTRKSAKRKPPIPVPYKPNGSEYPA